jgi:hypothetical protein
MHGARRHGQSLFGRLWPVGLIAMYRVCVDQQTRQEIAAAGAAHRELGPNYDDAVAEGLVERIGAEIDKRVDARLAQDRNGLAPSSDVPARRDSGGQVSPAAHITWQAIIFGLGSMLMGVLATTAVLGSGGSGGVVVFVWFIIGLINVALFRRR